MKIDLNDILKLLNDIIEVYRNCTVENENMRLDIAIDEQDVKKLELLVYALNNNHFTTSILNIELQIIQDFFTKNS